ncbi:hypothetical protein F5Y09DRAFT_356266 [Xylaria sp. FL1042]|nr:hypothetical protein F5Y09DRAFT_356266 [Xylaria sp. FL1042]
MDTDSDDEMITRPPIQHRNTFVYRKRQAEEGSIARAEPPPLKRRKGGFNGAYLNLLNQDIQDASSGLIDSGRGGEEEEDSASALERTQIGAVVWSATEKKAFFEAVGRRGRDDLAGIAARIGTKSALEVQQYLYLLTLDARSRADEGGRSKGRGRGRGRGVLRPVDFPAAVEIGAECGALLEDAADGLSLRQERYEEEVERERWGSRWRVTGPLARILGDAARKRHQRRQRRSGRKSARDREEGGKRVRRKGRKGEEEEGEDEEGNEGKEEKDHIDALKEMPFLELFPVYNWLLLSDRVFMNSTVSDGNWRAVSEEDEPPAIQATALADFHGLVLSVTRRLLLAAMYVAESRVRTRSLADTPRRLGPPRLRVEDVEAAVSSLGMKRDLREFWARCARRLQLDVVDYGSDEDDLIELESEVTDTDEDGEEMDIDDDQLSTAESSAGNIEDTEQEGEESEEDDYEIMSYDEVEAALGFPAGDYSRSRPSSPESDVSSLYEHISSTSEDETNSREDSDVYEEERAAEDEDEDGLNAESIRRDIEEAMISQIPMECIDDDTDVLPPARQALKSRIRAEHRLERDAERLDAKASADAETKLWALLRGDGDARSRARRSRGSRD